MGTATEGVGWELHHLGDCSNEGHWSFWDDSAILPMVLPQVSEDQSFLPIDQERIPWERDWLEPMLSLWSSEAGWSSSHNREWCPCNWTLEAKSPSPARCREYSQARRTQHALPVWEGTEKNQGKEGVFPLYRTQSLRHQKYSHQTLRHPGAHLSTIIPFHCQGSCKSPYEQGPLMPIFKEAHACQPEDARRELLAVWPCCRPDSHLDMVSVSPVRTENVGELVARG
jgi:predicted RNA binding protein YcfA (HicA-like mRNA interferase family)